MDLLPVEIIEIIASYDIETYRGCLVITRFSRTLTYSHILDFKILFGHSVSISARDIRWYKNDLLHREEGPASETINKSKKWYRNGKFHRENGPAIEYANGKKEWWRHNKLHREDGPAIECPDGTKSWYRNDKLHREDGPAVELPNEGRMWF